MSGDLQAIRQILISHSAKGSKDFFETMVPGTQRVYGVKTPVLNKIVSAFKEGSFGLAEELWKAGSLEERIIAIKIMEKKGKNDPARLIRLFKRFAKDTGNWAVCDGLGMQFLRSIVKTHSREIFTIAGQLNRSKDFWQRRLSLVMVEWYTRDPSYHRKIKKLISALENDEAYYVRKAVSWINRNFAKEK